MADEDEVTEMRVRARLHRTGIEVEGKLGIPVTGRPTEDGLNAIMDAISMEDARLVKK